MSLRGLPGIGVNGRAARAPRKSLFLYGVVGLLLFACQEKKESGAASSDTTYYHPSVATAPSGTTTSATKTDVQALSLTEDVVLEVGTTTVTIPAGTFRDAGTAVLQSFSGTFVNASTLRLVSESLILTVTRTDNSEFAVSEVFKDILIEQKTVAKSTASKLVALFDENARLTSSEKLGINKKQLAEYILGESGGAYRVRYGVRTPRLGFVLGETAVGALPPGYGSYTLPARNPTNVVATATTPADVTVTWDGDPRFNQNYGMIAWASGETEPDCTKDQVVVATTSTTITAATTSASYTATLTDLLDGTLYNVKVCGLSARSPADSSGGTTTTVTTPARALAILSNTPSDPSNATAMNITVSGTNVVDYQYAVLTNASTCVGATMSDWVPVATPITDAISQVTADTVKVCVLGRIDSTNVQLIATEANWTVDKTPPVFTSLALAAPAFDGYLSAADRALTTDILGTLTASGYETSTVGYKVVTSATTCDAALVYTTVVPKANNADVTVDGTYKICVRLMDAASNVTYGASNNFIVDTQIAFTSISLANGAADSYINATEATQALAVVSAASGTGYSTRKYAVTAWATTCDASLSYFVAIPDQNDAGFVTNADYKVCVEMSDAAGNKAFGSSAVIHRKVTLPAFTSLALANAAIDNYLNTSEHGLTSALASNLVGTNYDAASYAVSHISVPCNTVVTWSASIPQADDAGISIDGDSYVVCTKLTDNAGNTPAYGQTSVFVYDNTAPQFTSLALDGVALDGYLSGPDVTAASNTHATVIGSGFSSEAYAVVVSATACDGSLTYGSSIKKSSDTGFVSGATYKICAEISDLAGNKTYGASASVTVVVATADCTAISLDNAAANQWLNISEHSASTALSSVASTTLGSPIKTYALISSASACDASATFGAQDVLPLSDDAALTDGASYKVCAKITDIAGNTPAYCATTNFTVDLTAPAFTSLPLASDASDGYLSIAEYALTSDVVGPLTANGQTSEEFSLVTSGTTCGFPLTYTSTIPKSNHATFAGSGTYKVCVKLSDAAGNTTYDESPAIVSDQVPPTFNSLALANEASGGYINLAESVSVLAAADTLDAAGQTTTEYAAVTSVSACSTGAYGALSPTIANLAGLGDGTYKVCVKLLDVAGNETYGATSGLVVDLTTPSFSAVNLANDAVDTYINFAEHSLTNNLTVAATGTGQDTISYVLASDGTACSGVGGGWAASIPKNNDTNFGADGDYIVCVRLSDYAGNPDSFGSSSVIHLKTDFPVFTSLALANDVTDGYLNASERANSNALADNLSASGHVNDQYIVTTQATTCNNALTYGAMPLSSSGSIVGLGNYKVCAALTDIAGNVTYGATASFEFDSAAPVFTSLALANDVVNGWLNQAEHLLNNDLGTSLIASGYSVAEYAVVTSATTCNGSVTYGAMPQSSNGSLVDASTWKLCVKLADAAGNIAYGTSSATFVTDFGVPNFTSLSLTGVVSDSYVNQADETAASNLVSAAVGSNHTSTGYALVASATTCDGSLTYGSIPKSNSSDFSADGSFKVCAALSDDAGNTVAYGASTTFIRDVTNPTSSVTTTGTLSPSSTVGASTTLAGTASDATSGLSLVQISIQEGSGNCFSVSSNEFSASCPNWISATGTTNWTYTIADAILLKGATYTVESRATDLAVGTGNIQTTYGSSTFTFSASDGQELWGSPIVYDNGGDDRPLASTVDSDGDLLVVGYHTATDKNWLIKKFDKRGNEDTTGWDKDLGDVGADEVAYGVATDSTKNVYVVGSFYNGSNFDWWLKKFDVSGTEDVVQWDLIVSGGSGNDEARAVAVDSSDNVYVVGYGVNLAGVSTGEDAWIRKYSSAGVLACEKKIDVGAASLNDRALAIAVNNTTQRFFITGYQTVAGGDQQLFVKKMRTSDCEEEASQSRNSAGLSDEGAAIKLDSTGLVYVSGRTSAADADWWIIKYSANLVFQSEMNAAVAGNHQATTLAIDSSNRLFVGGYKTNGNEDFWLRKFSNTLVEDTVNWNKELDGGSGADRVTSISIGRGTNDIGAVYVIGYGTDLSGVGSGADWWIRKFSGP